MLWLLAQADTDLAAYTPDWWLAKFERYGYGGSLMLLVLWMLWRYVPRIIEAFINATTATIESTAANKEAIASLVDMNSRIVTTQEAAVNSASTLVDLHASAAAREEKVISKACDLVELVTTRVAPDLLPEVKTHTSALRVLAYGKGR
jgi:hypothetical protein